MAKLLLLWNVKPDQEKELGEVLERLLSGLSVFRGVRDVSFNVAMPPSSTFRSASGEPRYGWMVEVDVRSSSALSHLWSDPDYRLLVEEFMATVADFTAFSFQRNLAARDMLMRQTIRRVPVVRGGAVAGIVSREDVIRAMAGL